MKKLSMLVLAALLAGLTACGSPDLITAYEPVTTQNDPASAGKQEEPPKPTTEPIPITSNAVNLSQNAVSAAVTGREADSQFIAAQTKFALDLLKHTVKENSGANTFISPYSAMQALAMTANGAGGITRSEMEKALGGIPLDTLNQYLYTQRTSQPESDGCSLLTANSIWIRNTGGALGVKPDFIGKTHNYFGADTFAAPFDKTTVNEINMWCGDNTHGMIPALLSDISPETMMYIINAVVFEGKWQTEYTESQVRECPFTNASGMTETAQMMYGSHEQYIYDENAEGFLSYYQGGRYAFAALLPKEGLSVEDYIAGLDADTLQKTLTEPQHCSLETGLPKFTMDFDTEFSQTLSAMGMPAAFSEAADFGNLSDSPLHISQVLHKTHIEVDEKGTKAAAVTAVQMDNEDCEPDRPKVIILNRPFVYCIVDTETMLPVFLGTLNSVQNEKPSGTQSAASTKPADTATPAATTTASLSAQTDAPEYLVGTYFGGYYDGDSNGGAFYDVGAMSAKVTVCTNRDLLVSFPGKPGSESYDYNRVLKLSEEQYQAIAQAVDREALLTLDPENDEGCCDGTEFHLMLYDASGALLKDCGGYMPKNKEFWAMYLAVQENLPVKELELLRRDWLNQLEDQNSGTQKAQECAS